jgi:hypothetical protein
VPACPVWCSRCSGLDVGEDWMFDRHDPRNALPERKPFEFTD